MQTAFGGRMFLYFARQAFFVDATFILPRSAGFISVRDKFIGKRVQWHPCPPPSVWHKWTGFFGF